jgi:hypothetical protein
MYGIQDLGSISTQPAVCLPPYCCESLLLVVEDGGEVFAATVEDFEKEEEEGEEGVRLWFILGSFLLSDLISTL